MMLVSAYALTNIESAGKYKEHSF